MAISAVSIITLATPPIKRDVPGIQVQVRDRLEWIWGLGHDRLDEHLQGFADPQSVLIDEALLVFPRNDIIREIWLRHGRTEFGVRRPPIQRARHPAIYVSLELKFAFQLYKGSKSFEYLVVPIDYNSPLPVRLMALEVPPHLALCTTSGKMMKAWGHLLGKDCDVLRASLAQRSAAATHDGRPALTKSELDIMQLTHRTWTRSDYVPPSFLSETSDQTMVEVEEEERPVPKQKSPSKTMEWEVGSSASRHEPKRRLLPTELHQDPANIRLFPSADGDDDDDDAISADSHISGVEDPDEFAKASAARGDYELDRRWLTGIKRWAKSTSGAGGDDSLLNDTQIKEDPREQPRAAASLDLDKPDYLLRQKKRTAT
ncbi:hypothetical protein B0H19DRAFT_1242660 [Mycena capillaripes]|nr:hypothetical protein B0H19DRAFT_1242660 [Mycena capillaripes]